MALNKSVRNINYKINFSYWLAGLIDRDGYLGMSKKGYTCCEISVGVIERSLLLCVQKRLGGRITLRFSANSNRWGLHDRNGMVALVEHINGEHSNTQQHSNTATQQHSNTATQLRCVMLCYAVLCCVMLCYAVLCCVSLCCLLCYAF